jgi:hypothetical protein
MDMVVILHGDDAMMVRSDGCEDILGLGWRSYIPMSFGMHGTE